MVDKFCLFERAGDSVDLNDLFDTQELGANLLGRLSKSKKSIDATNAAISSASPAQMVALKKRQAAEAARYAAQMREVRAEASDQARERLRTSRLSAADKVAEQRARAAQRPAPRVTRAAPRPLSVTHPAAYRELVSNASGGGMAGMRLLRRVHDLAELQNTRTEATHEHRIRRGTNDFRRSVLKELRRKKRPSADLESLWWLESDDVMAPGIDCMNPDSELGFNPLDIINPIKHIEYALNPAAAVKAVSDAVGGAAGLVTQTPAQVVQATAQQTKKPLAHTNAVLHHLAGRVAKLEGGRAVGGTTARDAMGMSMASNMMKLNAAKDITAMATKTPKITARSTGKGANGADNVLVGQVARAVNQKLAPELNQINSRLRLAANQRDATSEHLNINNEKSFRKKVLKDLLGISSSMPAGQRRANVRRIGIMSGLL